MILLFARSGVKDFTLRPAKGCKVKSGLLQLPQSHSAQEVGVARVESAPRTRTGLLRDRACPLNAPRFPAVGRPEVGRCLKPLFSHRNWASYYRRVRGASLSRHEEESNVEIHQRLAVMAWLSLSLVASGISVAQSSPGSGKEMSHEERAVPGLHDFDFLVGHWRVHHRKLKQRLANSHEWIEFEGTLFSQPLMGGYANVDDDVFEVPGGTYRGVAPRSFDAKSGQWSIWWMDSRTPLAPLDPPVRGSFHDGVGTFYADDTENGKPIRIRFVWSEITPTSCHWEQAYSPDGGKTWETNWIQDIKRVQ
jgi:hypothetical protein